MAKVLFEDKGPNYQVPGLPYEETFNYVHPVVLDDVPTISDLEKLLDESDSDTLTNPWSIQVLRGFQAYIPTTFKRVTQGMPKELLQECFGIREGWIPEQERVLLQLQTEIEAKAATIDAAIVHHRRELGTVVNKAHLLNRIYMIGRIYGHLREREYPFLFGDLTDESKWDEALSAMKMQFMEYMMEVPQGERRHGKKIRRPEVSQKELDERFIYVDWLKEKLGDDLQGVLLYGSAARTDDPAIYSDFDNWVRVRDVARAHKILAGTCPVVFEGKVVEMKSCEAEEPEGSKHVGIHIFPDSEDYIIRHIKFLHDSREFLKHTRVLYGEFPFIKVRQDEVVERGISQAYLKLKTIAGSLNWAHAAPEKILGKPSLFEFIVKNVRFFLQHSLNAIEEPRFRDKEELNVLLEQRGLHIPEYRPDLAYIRHSLLYAMVSVLHLQKEFIQAGRKPNLSFLTENKRFEWNSPDINEWGKYDDD
jgi:predicted nucleotidyltransferase